MSVITTLSFASIASFCTVSKITSVHGKFKGSHHSNVKLLEKYYGAFLEKKLFRALHGAMKDLKEPQCWEMF